MKRNCCKEHNSKNYTAMNNDHSHVSVNGYDTEKPNNDIIRPNTDTENTNKINTDDKIKNIET